MVKVTAAREIALWWTPPVDRSGIASYRVFRGGTALLSVGTNSATDANLKTATRYCYAVSAIDGAGNESGRSAESCASTPWAITPMVGTGEQCESTTIAVDSANRPHIAFISSQNAGRDIRYATETDGAWGTTPVIGGDRYQGVRMVADRENHLHIVFNLIPLLGSGGLSYLTDKPGYWHNELMGVSGSSPSVGIDSSGALHVAFYDGHLKYATNASGAWVFSTIDDTGDVGSYNALVVDSADQVQVLYHAAGASGELRAATKSADTWSIGTVDDAGFVGEYVSVAADSSRHLHAAYYDATRGALKYATNASGAWVATAVEEAGETGRWPSIALDSGGHPHVMYYDATNKDLRYAANTSGAWVTMALDADGDAGSYASLAIDTSDKLHVAYCTSDGAVRYATSR